jgi:hypothetical protein
VMYPPEERIHAEHLPNEARGATTPVVFRVAKAIAAKMVVLIIM